MTILTFEPKKETFSLEKNLDSSIMNNKREINSWWRLLTEEEKTKQILKALE